MILLVKKVVFFMIHKDVSYLIRIMYWFKVNTMQSKYTQKNTYAILIMVIITINKANVSHALSLIA